MSVCRAFPFCILAVSAPTILSILSPAFHIRQLTLIERTVGQRDAIAQSQNGIMSPTRQPTTMTEHQRSGFLQVPPCFPHHETDLETLKLGPLKFWPDENDSGETHSPKNLTRNSPDVVPTLQQKENNKKKEISITILQSVLFLHYFAYSVCDKVRKEGNGHCRTHTPAQADMWDTR